MTDMDSFEKQAIRRALHLLEQRDYTERGLREKLRLGDYPEELAEKVLGYVKSQGYLDDERYAENYIRYRLDTRSRQQLMQSLYRKGIDRQTFQAAWDEVTREEQPDERGQVRRLIEKKYGDRRALTEKEYRRLQAFMARRGFSWELVASVFEEERIEIAPEI